MIEIRKKVYAKKYIKNRRDEVIQYQNKYEKINFKSVNSMNMIKEYKFSLNIIKRNKI